VLLRAARGENRAGAARSLVLACLLIPVAGSNGDNRMARALWKGSLSFGLIEIPVVLLSAETPNELKLSYLDRRDLSPVGYLRVNKKTGEEVPWEDIVRGYEHEPGEYVVLSKADLQRASPEATRTIEILHFVDEGEIESVYYDKPYYVAPAQPKSKAYVLLREALERTKKIALAKFVLHSREHLCALTVRENVLVLETLRFPYELRPTADVEVPDTALRAAGIQPREVEMATRLVEQMTEPFEPEKYRDNYREDLLELVEDKIQSGQSHTLTEETEEEEEVPAKESALDLMPLLRRSLEVRAGSSRKKTAARQSRTPRRKKAGS
jgi:DNA end-binding protein Ku